MRTIARMLFLLAGLTLGSGLAHAAGMLTSVEAMSSTIMQRHQSSFSGLGLRGRVKVPQLIEGFSAMPTLEYWRNQSTIQTFGIQSTRKDASMAGVLRYDFRRQGWQPYVGVGLGIHFLSSEVNAPRTLLVAPATGVRSSSISTNSASVPSLPTSKSTSSDDLA